MIIAADQPKYDAYWNACRRIQGSGLRITTHPVVGPLLASACWPTAWACSAPPWASTWFPHRRRAHL